MICWSFFTEVFKEVFLPRWKRLQSGLGMVLFFGKSEDAVTRVTGSGSREVGAEKFQHLSATSSGCWFPKSQSLPMVGGTLMALIHLGPKCPHARPVLGPCLNIQNLPCFLLMPQEMCSVCLGLMVCVGFTWLFLLSLFLSLSPLVLLVWAR